MRVVCFGIDPGVKGGITCLRGWLNIRKYRRDRSDYRKYMEEFEVFTTKMPECENSIIGWIKAMRNQTPKTNNRSKTIRYAIIEKVGGYVSSNFGVPGMGASMFTFGMSYGGLRMALCASDIPFEAVSPKEWEAQFDLSGIKEARVDHKRRIRDKAKEMFPDVNVTLDTADSLLLSLYGVNLLPDRYSTIFEGKEDMSLTNYEEELEDKIANAKSDPSDNNRMFGSFRGD